MAELIDISNEKFWDILFDEACVEGQQAERIEKALKTISTTEAEIRESAIDEFAEETEKQLIDFDTENGFISFGVCLDIISKVAEQLKEE